MDRHLHLYGALSPVEALDLAAGHAVDWGWLAGRWRDAGLQPPDFAGLARRRRDGDPGVVAELDAATSTAPAGFAAFQARYDLVIACSRWASGRHDQWEPGLTDELALVCAHAAARGPAEARVLLPGTATDRWAAEALEHLATAARRSGLSLAISVPRQAPLRHWPLISAAAARHDVITGIDLCGVEDEPASHAPLSAAIAAWNAAHAPRRLDLLVHVGEQLHEVQPLTALRRVWDAIAMGANRLGHALATRLDPSHWPITPTWERVDERRARLAWLQWQADRLDLDADAIDRELSGLAGADPAGQIAATVTDPGLLRACQDLVLDRVRSTRRIIEVCPTSNRVVSGVGIEHHGIARLQRAGIAWEVGSDDPGVLGTDLANERRLAGLV